MQEQTHQTSLVWSARAYFVMWVGSYRSDAGSDRSYSYRLTWTLSLVQGWTPVHKKSAFTVLDAAPPPPPNPTPGKDALMFTSPDRSCLPHSS